MTKFYFTEIKVSPDIHLNTWKYNVCSIKLEMKVMRLHRIWVEKISLVFFKFISILSMTFDYYLLCFKFNQFDLFTEVYHNCILYTSQSK